MAFLCGPRQEDDFGEQPTEPMRAQPELKYGPPLRPSFDPTDFAETWPELASIDVEALINGAIQRNRERPCPICIYVRVVRDGEIVEIGPQIARLCERHMRTLARAKPDAVGTMYQIYEHIFDWYHAPPDGEYSR